MMSEGKLTAKQLIKYNYKQTVLCRNLLTLVCGYVTRDVLKFLFNEISFLTILGTPDDLWTPYKHLNKVVESFLSGKATENSTFELTLRKFKQNFINLLKNSVSRSCCIIDS